MKLTFLGESGRVVPNSQGLALYTQNFNSSINHDNNINNNINFIILTSFEICEPPLECNPLRTEVEVAP